MLWLNPRYWFSQRECRRGHVLRDTGLAWRKDLCVSSSSKSLLSESVLPPLFFFQLVYFQNSQCKHNTVNNEAKLSKIIINKGQSSSTSVKMDFRSVFIFFGVTKSMTRHSNWIKTKQKGHFYILNSREFEIFCRSSYLNFQVPFFPIKTLTLV